MTKTFISGAALAALACVAMASLPAHAADKSAATETSITAKRGLLTGTLNPQPVLHRGGMVSQELTEDTLLYSVVRRNADGTLTTECLTGTEAADRAVKASTRAASRNLLKKLETQ